ncbi:MAG: hypothetical protein WC043_04205 [Pseudobdellovibrionaceae bacterium]
MNHHSQKVLESIFAHPVSANIDFKDVEHVLTDLGAAIEEKSGNRISIEMDGRSVILHRPHQHSLPKEEVAQLRGFLIDCGIDPANASK